MLFRSKVSAKFDWAADVSNPPTIGTSTLTAANVWSYVTRTLSEFSFPVTVSTNNDKTGYSLSQEFPANFASLAITGAGAVTVGTVNDKTGYSISGAITTLDAAISKLATDHGAGSWVTATGFSTHSAADVVAALGTGSTLTACATATGFSTLSAADVTGAVWDATMADHTSAGTTGQALAAAGGAADPLLNEVPGDYVSGTAGYEIGKLAQILEQVSLIQSGTAMTVVSAVVSGSTLTLCAGSNYLLDDGKALQIALPSTPIDEDSTASLAISVKPTPGSTDATQLLVATGEFVKTGDTWYARFDLTSTQTAQLAGTTYVSQRLWDLAEITPDGRTVAIYSAAPCTVTNLLDRT